MEKFELDPRLREEIRARVLGEGFMKIVQSVRRGGKTMWGQAPELGFEMVTFLTFLARYGTGGGTTRRMPKVALMSGFEKPPPPAPTAGKGAGRVRRPMGLLC